VPAPLPGRWFDGRTSQAQPVLVSFVAGRTGPGLVLQAADLGHALLLERTHAQIGWPERFSGRKPPTRVVVDLHEDGSLEIDDVQGWHLATAAAGVRPAVAARLQAHWPLFLAVLLLAAAGAWAGLRFGAPLAATQLARWVPLAWELQLSEAALAGLDARELRPSQVPAARQAELRGRFDVLARQALALRQDGGHYAPPLRLHFRRGMGANAFALPGGAIVMTDEMLEQATRLALPDDALVGVMAHEIGHVLHRHTTRMVIEQGVVNGAIGLALGDVSWMASTAATVMTGLAYRRAHEHEADCHAAALMQHLQVPAAPMADLLLALDAAAGGRDGVAPEPAASGGWTSLLSTHPDTRERATRLKRGEPSC
jgi:Zn-dependent protease with chaperone function